MLGKALVRSSVSAVHRGALGVAMARFKAVSVAVPSMGESITEGSIQTWKKKVGDFVQVDEVVAVIDTDKISVDVNAPSAGVITKIDAQEGDTVEVGGNLFELDTDKKAGDVQQKKEPAGPTPQDQVPEDPSTRVEKTVAMSRMRQRIGERLKSAQSEGVLLTTFQDLDMSAVMALRKQLGPEIQQKYGVKLGFMSFFLAACAKCLIKYPGINSSVSGKNVLERNYADISVAVATPAGLVVPVVKDCEKKNLLQLEKDLLSLATKARDNKLSLEEMEGGTFTISNGGIYGSLMGTPIINPPQAAILGMHGIKQTPVVRDGKIVARPIMYLALTYDHRIVDGREAVSFLKDVAELVQDPAKLLETVPLTPDAQVQTA